MSRRLAFSIGFLLFLLSLGMVSPTSAAPRASASACRQRFLEEMVFVRDDYRAVVFGSRQAPPGTVQSPYEVLGGGYVTQKKTGILETKGRLSSELVDPLVQSYRTFACRMQAVCSIVRGSSSTSGAPFNVKLLGCEDLQSVRYDECNLAGNATGSDRDSAIPPDILSLRSECDAIVENTLSAERAALKLVVGYDAGYRSSLQFIGMMSWMLRDLSVDSIRPIRDMVSLLGKLHQIPCFIGQCDLPDTSSMVK